MFRFVNAAPAVAAASVIGLFALGFSATASAVPPTPSPTPATTATMADANKLTGLLSRGYTASNCTPAALTDSVLAVVDCGQNSQPNGPVTARYTLYGSPDDMSSHLGSVTSDDVVKACSPNAATPESWHYNATPDQQAGLVSCGSYNGTPELVWTNSANSLLAVAQGPDVEALYQWWLKDG